MRTICFCLVFFGYLCYNAQVTIIPTNSDNTLLTISVLPNNIVIAGSTDYLAKSVDECNNLLPLVMPETVDYNNYLLRINSSLSYILSSGFNLNRYRVYKSTDDCNTWTRKLDTVGFFLRHLRFFNGTDGYAVTSTLYQSIRTNNGGDTWATAFPIPTAVPLDLQVFGDSLICLGGNNNGAGSFFVSQNRGKTWTGTSTFLETIPRKIQILNEDTFLVSSYSQYPAAFLKSIDKGLTFQKVDLPSVSEVYGIKFKNYSEGYILGKGTDNKGVILKTTDFGNTWTTFNSQIPCTLLDMQFINDSVAIVSGTGGVLFKWNKKTAVFTNVRENFANKIKCTVFPNPAKEILKIDIVNSGNQNLRFIVSNIVGKKILSGELQNQLCEINLRTLVSGLYFLTIQNDSEQVVLKIIKE